MLADTVSSLGLLLDVVGILLIWKYGLPWNYVESHITPEMRVHAGRSRLGLFVMAVGSFAQLIGVWI
jgi:hypothetical protein